MHSGSASVATARSYVNPLLWEDLPDMEVICVENVYYMSVSSFHFSPGAPILKSYNLVDWAYIGHSVPDLAAFGPRFRLDGHNTSGYVKGIWASTFKYRQSDGLFYWYGAIQGTDQTFLYTAKKAEGPWTSHPPIDHYYYDAGLLVDDDDTLYIAHGNKTLQIAQLTHDGLKQVKNQLVYESELHLEGARMYKIKGKYYVWVTNSWAGQYMLKSDVGPFGPYECRKVIGEMRAPIAGGGPPHQGALVETPDGRWYYMAFIDAFPAGRIPTLAPVEFDEDGWPRVVGDYPDKDGQWRLEYPLIHDNGGTKKPKANITKYSFGHDQLDHRWQWNQSPDDSKWNTHRGQLVLETATVTDCLFLAANTLTHRTIGPKSTATFCVNCAGLADGDRAGASLFRNESAYIGIHKDADQSKLVYVDDLKIAPVGDVIGWKEGRPVSQDWEVVSKGSIKAETLLATERVWLRIHANIEATCADGREKEPRQALFEYSFDGTTFTQIGPLFTMDNTGLGWLGYRFAVFSFATKALGGQLVVDTCEIEQAED
ncbi:glycosyl hydrolase [Penicillium cataractarum]|uniref:Glycosyl hydrolase n=1 Tax=Penicillium cataractarum TaxID=2100454 RepID=A0A9W9RDX7_9EURO|nr:glycosyl hydrolase [Penicillium cataractarum]KAJ5358477.1 glycosyl hydrolase [Penicillium cataractarum]